METGTPLEYIFSYGYNHPMQVADLLNIPLNELLPYCVPCSLKGYKRAFGGEDDYFENTSVATIVKDPNSSINSYAFAVESTNIGFIDEFEEYPEEYDRVKVDNIIVLEGI